MGSHDVVKNLVMDGTKIVQMKLKPLQKGATTLSITTLSINNTQRNETQHNGANYDTQNRHSA